MTGTQIVSAVIEILVSGLTSLATGIGEGVSALAKALFFETTTSSGTTTTTLSMFGTLIIVFAGISLAELLASINRYKNLESFNANQNGSFNIIVKTRATHRV